MFHGIRDPMQLDPPRYFADVALLHHYGGAVAAARGESVIEVPREVIAAPRAVTPEAQADVDNSAEIAALAAMSRNPGFPGIGYSGG